MSPRGDYRTIQEAMDAAVGAAILWVRPGVYSGLVLIEKPLDIVGDGPEGSVILESDDSDVVACLANVAIVRGLTIRCKPGKALQRAAVNVQHGKLMLKNCDISSDSMAAVIIHNPESDPILYQCKIHGSPQSGVLFCGQGTGVVDDCEVFENGISGIEVRQGSAPSIRNCRLYRNKASGAAVGEGSRCEIDGCAMWENGSAGVLAYAESAVAMENRDAYGNEGSNVEAKQSSHVVAKECRMHEGKAGGVKLWGDSGGEFAGCDIFGNILSGVEVKEGSDPWVHGCAIHQLRWRSPGARWRTRKVRSVRDCGEHAGGRRVPGREPSCVPQMRDAERAAGWSAGEQPWRR